MRDVMVREGELEDGKRVNPFYRILVAFFGAKVVNLDHTPMVLF